MRNPKKLVAINRAVLLPMLSIGGAVVAIDVLTKIFAFSHFSIVKNTGTILGLFRAQQTLVALVTFAILVVVAWMGMRTEARRGSWRAVLPAGLILGGGVGNLLDRLLHGFVTDFIHLPFWPTFNVADACITVGILVLLITAFFPRPTNNSLQNDA